MLFELVKNDKGEDDLKIILANKTFRDFPDKPGGNIEGMCFSECCTGGLESLPLYIETAKTGRKISRQYYARTLQRYVAADIFSPEPGQVAVLISDQTHLVEAQRELEKAYIDTEAILHEIPAPICVISKNNGQILGYNKAFCDLVNIYDNDKLLNTQVMELFRKNNEATLRASFQAGGKFKTELVLSDKNIEVEIYARSFTYKEQNAYAVYLLDLTAQQLQEQTLIDAARQAEEASKMKSTFLANMSHEIRTPMNGVLGFTELALDDTELSDNTREYLEKIRISANSLLNIINAVLDISKIEAGKVEVETIPFSINEILRQCETISSPEALDKGLSLYFYSDPPIKKMLIGDPTKIRQILLNLVSNSVKFTETGMVKLMVYPIFKNDSSVEIKFEVIDTGIGMTAEQLKKVLIPFNQADSSTTRRYGGTGLGLTITNNLITLMGGELKIESAPGVGSRFSFTLGFKVDEKYPDDTINPLTNDIVMRPTFNGDVLLCEDNKINQQVIIEHLTRIGLKVSSASNGLVGLEIIKAREKYGKPFDLILMDIHMPVMDGLTTTSLILQMGIKAPIIAITANVMARDREIYQNHGMCDFISKPFKAEELWRCLLKYLAPISLVPIDNINSGNSLSQSPTSAINTRLGIERSANDEALYIRLKAYYLKDNADKPTLIKEALTEKDYRKALRLSHTLKSSSATIGAVAMSLVAGKMENAVSEGQYDYAYSLLGELSNTFNEVISELRGEINPLVKEDVIHTMLSAEESISLLDELEPLLLTGASETLDYLERLGDLPDNLATELKNRINDYDFEEALELLNKIRKHITK